MLDGLTSEDLGALCEATADTRATAQAVRTRARAVHAATVAVQARVEQRLIDIEVRLSVARLALAHHD